MPDLHRLLSELRKTGVSDLHIYPGESCFTRRDGKIGVLKDIRFPEDEVKKIILSTSSPKAREILGKARQVNFAYIDPEKERYRFSVFFDRGKFALAVRFIPATPPKLSDLGLPEPIKKILSKTSGLVIVGSPSGHGKTTTIAAVLDFVNQHFEKNIITVENPVEFQFKDNRSSFIQRAIPLDVPNFFEGLNEAYRLDPDVVVTDSISYADAFDQALFLCEAGCMVIGAADGGDCQKILERLIFSRPVEQRDIIKSKLMTHLSLIICQRLVPKVDLGRVAVFDIIVNNAQVKSVLKGDKLDLLKTPQEQDRESGMQNFERGLKALVNKLVITPAVAADFFGESSEVGAKFLKSK
jgi:twitching motility protein PilT